jgi:hypothetical protein
MHHPVLLLCLLSACTKQVPPNDSASDDIHELDIVVCDPSAGPFSLDIDNPFLPLPVGSVTVLEGEEEGETVRVQVSVLDEVEMVADVETRVVEEREWEGAQLVEVSLNFFVQEPAGSVCYFGEDVDDYEDGQIVGHAGAWRAGEDGALPGILMPTDPQIGMTYRQEVAPGVAEDRGEITAMGTRIVTPGGTFDDTLTVRETSPLDAGASLKHYARGVGMIYDDGLDLAAD